MRQAFVNAIKKDDSKRIHELLTNNIELLTHVYINNPGQEMTCLMLAVVHQTQAVLPVLIDFLMLLPNAVRLELINRELLKEEDEDEYEDDDDKRVTVFYMVIDEPLTRSYYSEDEKIFFGQRLIDAGADIYSFNSSKVSPLHIAAENRQVNLFKWLVENGADITARSYVCSMISAPVSQIHPEYDDSLIESAIEIIDYLIENGADINENNGELLSRSLSLDSLELFQCLFNHQVDVTLGNYSLNEISKIIDAALRADKGSIVNQFIKYALLKDTKEHVSEYLAPIFKLCDIKNLANLSFNDYSQDEMSTMLTISVECNAANIAEKLIFNGAPLTVNHHLIAKEYSYHSMTTMLLEEQEISTRIDKLKLTYSHGKLFPQGLATFNETNSVSTWLTRKDALSWMSAFKQTQETTLNHSTQNHDELRDKQPRICTQIYDETRPKKPRAC